MSQELLLCQYNGSRWGHELFDHQQNIFCCVLKKKVILLWHNWKWWMVNYFWKNYPFKRHNDHNVHTAQLFLNISSSSHEKEQYFYKNIANKQRPFTSSDLYSFILMSLTATHNESQNVGRESLVVLSSVCILIYAHFVSSSLKKCVFTIAWLSFGHHTDRITIRHIFLFLTVLMHLHLVPKMYIWLV